VKLLPIGSVFAEGSRKEACLALCLHHPNIVSGAEQLLRLGCSAVADAMPVHVKRGACSSAREWSRGSVSAHAVGMLIAALGDLLCLWLAPGACRIFSEWSRKSVGACCGTLMAVLGHATSLVATSLAPADALALLGL
jgi:hypothetical protein